MTEIEKKQGKPAPAAPIRSSLLGMTRRQLLAGAGQVALLTTFAVGCVPMSNHPWADGTFWDDGSGWTD